ncbi:hypothetical protein Cflav_PD0289 [Pedosphaera parvula Ellin514]|uniref:Uncharacterized protein n=2 Tax=Pedosphaera TaxID=1032526 RepID=B9XSE3_PEDPL|nr:hypothetical protein Cflav_PD0289 [Pedosphaera parvula Ellin514]
MNENRMKTSVNTGEVSLPPAQAVGWGRKIRAEPGACTAKQISSTENWLATPSDGRIIAKMTGETNLQHEHQGKWEIPV